MSEMVNMAPPWQGMTPEEISRAVAASERPLIAPELAASAPTGWIELMQQCWEQDATNRPNFDAIHDALEQVQGSMECEGAESEGPSETEMITQSGNDELVMELQLKADQHKQDDTNNVTTV